MVTKSKDAKSQKAARKTYQKPTLAKTAVLSAIAATAISRTHM